MRPVRRIANRTPLIALLTSLAAGSGVSAACQPAEGPAPVVSAAAAPPVVYVVPQDVSAAGASEPAVAAGPVPAPAPEPLAAPTPLVPAAGASRTPLIAINMPTPAPLAPPPLAKPPSTLALPVLPPPSNYPRATRSPPLTDTEPCGMTWTGAAWVANECIEPMTAAAEGRPAQVVVPYELMRPGAVALPPMVDHRADRTEGDVRHQVGAQCTAFAFTSALDHDYATWTGQPASWSVMQVWARYHTHSELEAAAGNIGDSLASEADFPYNPVRARAWGTCPKDPTKRKPGERCGEPVDQATLASLEPRALGEITQIELLPLNRLDVLREKLAAGFDATISVRLHSYQTAGDPGAKYIIGEKVEPPPKKGTKEHQLLIVGYAMTQSGTYYLVHNSFGTHWGDNGFAWAHEDILRAHAAGRGIYVPHVQPRQVAALRLRADTGLSPRCAPGMVPDSISGVCAGICPDGSPRHNDVCAVPNTECPTGSVNVTGACLLAAPSTSGVDPASRVSFQCGPAGCSYGIPANVLGCRAAECAVSCPAPAFRLATSVNGLACIH